jgi:hypothetical protein
MSRRLRFIPDRGALVEVTSRALHSRFLLRPGPSLNPIVLGALARSQQLYPVRVCASQAVHRQLRDAYFWFVAAYRDAAEKL